MTAFSQQDTASDHCFTTRVTRLIAADLVSGDLAKQELTATQVLLGQEQEKVQTQSIMLQAHQVKDVKYEEELKRGTDIQGIQQNTIDRLEKRNRGLGRETRVLSIGLSVSVAAVVVLVLTR